VMKCRKGKGSIIPGHDDDFSKSSSANAATTIDIESINTTDKSLPPRSERTKRSCGCHRGTEVWVEVKTRKFALDFQEDRRGNVFICLICHDITKNTVGLGTEIKVKYL